MHAMGKYGLVADRARDVLLLPRVRGGSVVVTPPQGWRTRQRWGRRSAVLEESNAAITALNELYGSSLAAPPSVGPRAEFDALPICQRSALRRVYNAIVDIFILRGPLLARPPLTSCWHWVAVTVATQTFPLSLINQTGLCFLMVLFARSPLMPFWVTPKDFHLRVVSSDFYLLKWKFAPIQSCWAHCQRCTPAGSFRGSGLPM